MDSQTRLRLDGELHALAMKAGLTIERLTYQKDAFAIMCVSDTIIDTVPVIRMTRLLRFRKALKHDGHVLSSIRPLCMGDEIVLTIRLSHRVLDA